MAFGCFSCCRCSLTLKQTVAWAAFFALFTIAPVIRHFYLGEKFVDLVPVFGPKPTQHEQCFVWTVAVIGFVLRALFVLQPMNINIAQALHMWCCWIVIPVTCLNVAYFMTYYDAKTTKFTPAQWATAACAQIGVIANAAVHGSFYSDRKTGLIASVSRSVSRASSSSSAAWAASPSPVVRKSAAAAKKPASRAGSAKAKSGSRAKSGSKRS